MKKIFKVTLLYSLALFSVMLVSCKGTGNKTSGQNANDSVQVADSLSSDSLDQRTEPKEVKEDLTLGGKGDLAAFDLHGNVKSCKWKDEFGATHNLVFDENGKWIKYNGKPLSALEEHNRDKQTLQLLSGANKIGDEVSLNVDGCADGTTAVDFSDLGLGADVAKLLADSRKVVSF